MNRGGGQQRLPFSVDADRPWRSFTMVFGATG
jgi:hypothetical protein